MFIGTHALLPVCIGLGLENASLVKGRGYVFPPWSLAVVGVFDVLPDFCSPHLSLGSRLSSWSHTVWFLAGLVPVCGMVASFFPKGMRWRTALLCWIAAMLHLAADAISGGIAWLYPWRPEKIGDYYIPSGQWPWWDVGFILLFWFLLRLRPHAEARGMDA